MMISTICQNNKSIVKKILIIVFWLLVWQIVALLVNNSIMLVGPAGVIKALVVNVLKLNFWKNVFASAVRIGGGFCMAFFIGLGLAILSYRFIPIYEVLNPVVVVIKSVPVVSFVVLLLIWFGAENLSFFIVTLIVFPSIYINCLTGLRETDRLIIEMANQFEFGPMLKVVYIYRDAIKGPVMAGVKVSLGLAFKSGVAAEVIGLPELSIGTRIYMSKIYLDTADLFAWTIVVLLVSAVFEKMIVALLKWAFDYKPKVFFGGAVKSGNRQIGDDGQIDDLGAGVQDIHIDNINVSYDGKEVLKNVNIDLVSGRIYCLMGPSGHGKTTLLREVVKRFSGKTSVMYQEDRLLLRYDTITNVALANREITEEEYVCLAKRILPEDCLYLSVDKLSGGMKRRVAFLRAMLFESQLIVLDEPFTGLDEETKNGCIDFLNSVRGKRTVLMVTHDESDIKKVNGEKVWIQELH